MADHCHRFEAENGRCMVCGVSLYDLADKATGSEVIYVTPSKCGDCPFFSQDYTVPPFEFCNIDPMNEDSTEFTVEPTESSMPDECPLNTIGELRVCLPWKVGAENG